MKPPAIIPAIFTFGVPRSGTTFGQHWLMQIPPQIAHVVKIAEHTPLHPLNSDNGLIYLRHLYADRPVLFVRMWRRPENVFKSFYAARMVVNERIPEQIRTPMKGLSGLAKHDDENIFRFIGTINANLTKQMKGVFEAGKRTEFIRVDFDRLNQEGYTANICELISKMFDNSNRRTVYDTLFEYVRKNYNRKPIRSGALSHGLKGKVELPPELAQEIKERYG